METEDPLLGNAKYAYDSIPENVPNDSLEDVDDMSMRQQRKERFSQNTRFRKHLAVWVMYIVPIWLFVVIVVLVLSGANVLHFDSNVLITLLATTTVNVLGLAYIVLKGIFPEEHK